MSPSVGALQKILHICENFAADYNVMFNERKTQCIAIGFNGALPNRSVYLNGSAVSWVTRVKHLGNLINFDLNDKDDILFKKSVFISQVNNLNAKFASIQSRVRGKLLQTYCCSWYGCQTWDAAGKFAIQVNTEWNKAVRRTLRIPYSRGARGVFISHQSPKGLNSVSNAEFSVVSEKSFLGDQSRCVNFPEHGF